MLFKSSKEAKQPKKNAQDFGRSEKLIFEDLEALRLVVKKITLELDAIKSYLKRRDEPHDEQK